MSSSTTLGLLALTTLLSCGGIEAPRSAHTRQPITGGEVDDGDPAVVSLLLTGGGGCTGTLISPRMILTAAHCPLESPTWGTARFGTASNVPTRQVAIIDSVVHPTADLRLAKLSIPIGDITPVRINRTSLSSSSLGKRLRHVGFGLDAYPTGGSSDTKRHTSLTVIGITTGEVDFSSSDGLSGVCFGDSGGPGLMRTEAGTEEFIAGVASHLLDEPFCYAAAADVRVDTFADWIDDISATWELQGCDPGDGCKANCVPVDTDCVCVHDAVCDLRCPMLSLDPDCDPECSLVSDGMCSGAVCPFRDPDCAAPGATCVVDAECQSRTCASQAGKRFCSRGCSKTDECSPSMYCSPTNHVCLFRPRLAEGCDDTVPCGEGACAEEPTGGNLCRETCVSSLSCLPTEQCLATASSPGVCRARAPVEPPIPKKQGCSAAPGTLWLALGALAALRRRRS